MESNLMRREAPCLDGLALAFIEARGKREIEFAFSSLQATGLAIGIANSCGITAESFYVHYDARLIFCACVVAHQHGQAVVMRLAQRALEEECAPYISPRTLDSLIEQYHFRNEFLLAIHLLNSAKSLARMSAVQRNAQEHLDHAKQLLLCGGTQ